MGKTPLFGERWRLFEPVVHVPPMYHMRAKHSLDELSMRGSLGTALEVGSTGGEGRLWRCFPVATDSFRAGRQEMNKVRGTHNWVEIQDATHDNTTRKNEGGPELKQIANVLSIALNKKQ